MKIKIIKTPPGFAPKNIREQWLGIEIPLQGVEDINNPLRFRSGNDNVGGYQVSPQDAVNALEKADRKEAADFWKNYLGAINFTFKKDVCELIE